MKLSIFKKISGILFLVSAFFVVISMVLAFNEYGASVLDDTLIFNTLCVILLVAAGVLSLLLRFEVPLFAVVGSYFVLNIIASIFYAFHWSWWSEGIFKTLGRMSTFILPTSAFVWPVTATSILLDLANLASITGSILLFISIASTRTTSHVIPTTSPSKTLSFENTMRTRSTSVMNAPSDTPNSMNSNELASPAVRLGSYLLESF
ncbi:MAG: hypothetical protein EXQ73_00005, partial [Candidatus Nanopelagicaceae bacterium]|nr:hypothetical protein [Candidatus Nanopelagicaceae bacterium]